MKKILIPLILFLITLTDLKAQNWTKLTTPYNYTINSCWIDETAPNNGLFVGWRLAGADPVSYGYKTIDGGNSYTFFGFNYYFWLAQDVYFTNSNNGIVVGSGIVKTFNSGNTWNVIIDNITMRGWMYDVMFTDANTGYTVGQTYDNSYTSYWGVIYKTTDGGWTWNDITITQELQNENTEFRSVYSTGNSVIYAGALNTLNNNSLFKSTDNGITWVPMNFFNDVNSIHFTSINTGFIASNQGIFKTTDAGLTWFNILQTNQSLLSINIKNSFGFAVGSGGTIYNTENNGLNWTSMTSPVNQTLNRVFAVDVNLAYAVGAGGTILKYQNTLVTGIENNKNTPETFRLEQNYPNPFNPSTTIKFNIPKVDGGKNSKVQLKVYDIMGKEVATLVNEELKAGIYEVKMDGSKLSSGTYFYKLITDNFIDTKKFILVK